jgi:DNA-binding protein H-NS
LEDISTLISQKNELDRKINEMRQRDRDDAINSAMDIITNFSLTSADLFPREGVKTKSVKSKVLPKFRDPKTGATWTGRGKSPIWFKNEKRNEFLIEPSATSENDTDSRSESCAVETETA